MAEDISQSFHSFGAASTSSFRIINPGPELSLPRGRSVVAPSLTESQYWDNHDFSAVPSRRMSVTDESEKEDGKSGITSSSGPPKRLPIVQTTSSSTVRPSAEKSATLAPATSLPALPSAVARPQKEPPRVLKREIWRDILLKSDGRDKTFVSGPGTIDSAKL